MTLLPVRIQCRLGRCLSRSVHPAVRSPGRAEVPPRSHRGARPRWRATRMSRARARSLSLSFSVSFFLPHGDASRRYCRRRRRKLPQLAPVNCRDGDATALSSTERRPLLAVSTNGVTSPRSDVPQLPSRGRSFRAPVKPCRAVGNGRATPAVRSRRKMAAASSSRAAPAVRATCVPSVKLAPDRARHSRFEEEKERNYFAAESTRILILDTDSANGRARRRVLFVVNIRVSSAAEINFLSERESSPGLAPA